jgi:predicted DNA-binding transcriptional regulator AlpA
MADDEKFTVPRGNNGRRPGGVNASSAPEIEMFTAMDLQQLLKIDVKTIYNYARRGLIPYVRIESNLRFPKQRILEWIEERTYPLKSTNKHL